MGVEALSPTAADGTVASVGHGGRSSGRGSEGSIRRSQRPEKWHGVQGGLMNLVSQPWQEALHRARAPVVKAGAA